MSNNVDKSLDVIIGEKRTTNRKHVAGRRGRNPRASKAVAAPVGGVRKPNKQNKPTTKGVPTGPSAVPRSSKIVVSGLVSHTWHFSVSSGNADCR